MRYSPASLVAVLVAVCLGGCLRGEEEAPGDMEQLLSDATPGQLVEEFTKMSLEPETYTEDYRRYMLIDRLVLMGPRTLTPIFEILAAPESSPQTRLFALQGLVGRAGPQYMEELKPMLASDDSILRACAVTLLGPMEHPEAVSILKEALNDSSERVSFSALSSLAVQGDPEARKDLCAKYFEPDRHKVQKEEIIRVILRAPVADDRKILTSALNVDFVPIDLRAMVAAALGRVGDSGTIGPLEQSLMQYTEPIFVELASTAVEAIKEREAQGSAGR